MKVAVLGCGPAGLMAAYACTVEGLTPHIYSKPNKSIIIGAQYLHLPIPNITLPEPEVEIKYVKVGTPEGYARKVYGNEAAPTSWDRFSEGLHKGWGLREA